MKKVILKFIYTIVVFILALFLIGHFTNAETVDMTAQMSAPSFPTLTFIENGTEINLLHGYAEEMDVDHIRGSILPISATRSFKFSMNTFGEMVSNLRFEVRQINGSSLVENTDITDTHRDGDIITGNIQLKDLIDANQEYMLVVLADIDGQTVRFYERVIWNEDGDKYHLSDELTYVQRFKKMTFDKNG